MPPETSDHLADLAQIEVVVVLQSIDLFRACRAEELLRLARISRQRRYAADEMIYASGERPDGIYCVVRGEVELTSESGSSRTVGPLNRFGVRGVLTGRMRGATARASSDALILFFDAEDFFDLLAHNIDIVKSLFRHVLVDAGERDEAKA